MSESTTVLVRCASLLGRTLVRVAVHQPIGLELADWQETADSQLVRGDVVLELDRGPRVCVGWQQHPEFCLAVAGECGHLPDVSTSDASDRWFVALGRGPIRRVEATWARPYSDRPELLRDVRLVGPVGTVAVASLERLESGRVFWPTDAVTVFYGEDALREAGLADRHSPLFRTVRWE